jgi:hypothetical protein
MLDWMTPQLARQVVNAEWQAKQHKVEKDRKPVKHDVVAKKLAPLHLSWAHSTT